MSTIKTIFSGESSKAWAAGAAVALLSWAIDSGMIAAVVPGEYQGLALGVIGAIVTWLVPNRGKT